MNRLKSSSSVVLYLAVITLSASALNCTQCKRPEAWMPNEDAEARIAECQQGLVAPTPCANASHTHCIVSWYRAGGSSGRIVTQRHCGVESDVTGCTLYNSKISRKVRRHLLGREDSNSVHRKETVASFVEVCSTSCPFGECVNSSNHHRFFTALFVFALFFLH
uniref:RING-CH-type domain-containing protein n=1 Tax=Caenorhabditis japonica TaxID=281687 RepID=A0A8R1ILQ1_CAEJA